MRTLHIEPVGRDNARLDRFERRAVRCPAAREADIRAINQDVSTPQRDLVACHPRDTLEEALALEVVGDLPALKAEHDQIATSDGNMLLDVDDVAGESRRPVDADLVQRP